MVGTASFSGTVDGNTVIYTLLGINRGGTVTIFDTTASSDGTDEAIKKAIEALDVSDSISKGSFVTSVSETDGKIEVKKGTVTSDDKTLTVSSDDSGNITVKANIDGKTIVKDSSTGVLSVDSTKLTPYTGTSAITVTTADTANTISLKIAAEEKVLSQSADGLKTQFSLQYTKRTGDTHAMLYLYGGTSEKTSDAIASVDVNDFIIDGMLQDAELVTTAETGVENLPKVPYIKLTFNSDAGSKIIRFSVNELYDDYKAGNGLTLNSHVFSAKVAENSGLKVDEDGIDIESIDCGTY